MQISVQRLEAAQADRIEVVEHKGLGHPDTLCDALAEELSVALSAFYMEHFGAVLHHNVDKALLVAGSARAAFGGGEVTQPIEIYLAGRATIEARGVTVPIEELAVETTKRWIRDRMHALDPDRHVRVHCLVRPGSADLVDLFLRQAKTGLFLANDTSCGVGYAPLSELERIVLAVARRLRELAADAATGEVGEDVKIMGIGSERRVRLTVSCAFVGRHVASLADYVVKKAELAARIGAVARSLTSREVEVEVNAADNVARSSVYLTVTGTSAEAGDDGQVGRGNRINGLITPGRPMVLEAAAGKNPVTHVGKIYGVLAQSIAADLAAMPGIAAAQCQLVSRIGQRLDEPDLADIRVSPKGALTLEEIATSAEALVRERIAEVGLIGGRILRREVRLF